MVEPMKRNFPWQVYLVLIWWGYINYLLNSIWPYSVQKFLMALVVLLVLIAVCWKYCGFVLPVLDKKVAQRSSIGLVVFMLLTGFAVNQYVVHEKRHREKLRCGPEVSGLAESVTYHLLDQSYINYKDFQKALLQGELSPLVRKHLQDKGILAQSNEALEVKDKTLRDSKQVTAVHIQKIAVRDKNDSGCFPVDVTGRIATQSTSGGEIVEKPFGMHYLVSWDLQNERYFVVEVSSESTSKEIDPGDVIGWSNLEAFARRVARHLVDSSYISYEDNSRALALGELAPAVVRQLQASNDLPKSLEEMNAICSQLKKDRQATAVRFDEVIIGEQNKDGFVPIDIRGQVATCSLKDTNQSKELKPFKFRFLIGVNTEAQRLVVVELEKK